MLCAILRRINYAMFTSRTVGPVIHVSPSQRTKIKHVCGGGGYN